MLECEFAEISDVGVAMPVHCQTVQGARQRREYLALTVLNGKSAMISHSADHAPAEGVFTAG